MKSSLQCYVFDSTGMIVHVFTTDGLYSHDEICNVFNMKPKSAKDGVLFGEIGVILYPNNATNPPKTILEIPSDEYRGKSTLVFLPEASRNLYRFVGFYHHEACIDKLVKLAPCPSISTEGRVLPPFPPSCAFRHSFVAKYFSRITVGACVDGRCQIVKDKGFWEKFACVIIDCMPLIIIGIGCYWAYKTVCARVDNYFAEKSVNISAKNE